MTKLASASINTFGPSPKAGFESPSEQLITLTYGQLVQAVQEAIQPLQDEIAQLREEITSLEAAQDTLSDNQLIQLRLIHELKEKAKRSPGKTELSRAEKIERYLAARPDHKATFETLRGHLGIDKDLLNDAIKTLMASSPGRYGIARAPGDKRKRALIMLPK
jgi:HPt (histidine-containing phosphotransfer) domain-containing protein